MAFGTAGRGMSVDGARPGCWPLALVQEGGMDRSRALPQQFHLFPPKTAPAELSPEQLVVPDTAAPRSDTMSCFWPVCSLALFLIGSYELAGPAGTSQVRRRAQHPLCVELLLPVPSPRQAGSEPVLQPIAGSGFPGHLYLALD